MTQMNHGIFVQKHRVPGEFAWVDTRQSMGKSFSRDTRRIHILCNLRPRDRHDWCEGIFRKAQARETMSRRERRLEWKHWFKGRPGVRRLSCDRRRYVNSHWREPPAPVETAK